MTDIVGRYVQRGRFRRLLPSSSLFSEQVRPLICVHSRREFLSVEVVPLTPLSFFRFYIILGVCFLTAPPYPALPQSSPRSPFPLVPPSLFTPSLSISLVAGPSSLVPRRSRPLPLVALNLSQPPRRPPFLSISLSSLSNSSSLSSFPVEPSRLYRSFSIPPRLSQSLSSLLISCRILSTPSSVSIALNSLNLHSSRSISRFPFNPPQPCRSLLPPILHLNPISLDRTSSFNPPLPLSIPPPLTLSSSQSPLPTSRSLSIPLFSLSSLLFPLSI